MASSEPAPAAKAISAIQAASSALLSTTDANVARINSLLSTTPTLDTTLTTATYTLQLLTALLSPLSTTPSPNPLLAKLLSRAQNPTTTTSLPLPRLAPILLFLLTSLPPSLKALSAKIDDTRTFLRLFNLPRFYALARRTHANPPKDGILRALAWGQIASISLYQLLENIAYLSGLGVLRVIKDPAKVGLLWRWSARCWMSYIALEAGRLGREYVLRGRVAYARNKARARMMLEGKGNNVGGAEGGVVALEGEEEEGSEGGGVEEVEKWWRQVYTNAAYAPMTVHYGFGGGLTEYQMALLGCVAGWVGMGEAWRKTA